VVPALLANAELHSGVVSGNLVQTLATVLTSTAASVDTLSVDVKVPTPWHVRIALLSGSCTH
jgi:hypothetical protein